MLYLDNKGSATDTSFSIKAEKTFELRLPNLDKSVFFFIPSGSHLCLLHRYTKFNPLETIANLFADGQLSFYNDILQHLQC